ncbi:MAG: LuxR C-terminal-related transcriptional regulator [Gemmatimonadetes bacterium]|nr:LuxR C-terminal-related transcriptional regulator [Gemmatimonadota bacterium]
MTSGDRFDVVVENLYRAAVADVSWESLCPLINALIGTVAHGLTYAEVGSNGELVISRAGFYLGKESRPDVERRYFRDYFPRDEAIPRLYGLDDGELVHKPDLYSDREKKTSAAYNEFHCTLKTQNGLFLGIAPPESNTMIFSAGNSIEREGWGNDQIEILEGLLPHLRRFHRVRRVLAATEALGASLVALLDNKRLGLIQLDRSGRILEANDRASEILMKRDGLRDQGGFLAAAHREEHTELQRLLARALPPHGPQGAGDSMKISRVKDRAPLVLEVHPVRQMRAVAGESQLGALVFVVDPAVRPRIDPDLVTRSLGLTPTESRVAVAIAGGHTVAGAAQVLGCAEGTARAHLRQVYHKLGIGKQTELVQRLLSLEPLG